MADQDYAATLISSLERRALIAFYNSTDGDGWSNKSGWKTAPLYPDGFAMPGHGGDVGRHRGRRGDRACHLASVSRAII